MKSVTLLVFTIVASCGMCQELEFSEDTKTINLSSNGIQTITLDFSAYTELEEIDLSKNDLTAIESDVFIGNSKLKYIDLSGNRKLTLPMGMFLETQATFVNLSDCNIEEIPENALDGMTHLEVLDLSENPIQFAESLGFESMKTPPRKFIISKITQAELTLVCKHIDTIFFVKDEGKEYECKDIRKKSPETSKASKPEKSDTKDTDVDTQIIEEHLIKGGTHLEMQSDDPMEEGSGDKAEEIDVEENDDKSKMNADKDNKPEVKINDEKPEEVLNKDEKPEVPNKDEKLEVPNKDEKLDVPNKDETPEVPNKDEKLDVPNKDEEPEVPNKDKKLDVPNKDEKPEVPNKDEKSEIPNKDEKPDVPLIHRTEHEHDKTHKEIEEEKTRTEDVIPPVRHGKGRSKINPSDIPNKDEKPEVSNKDEKSDSSNKDEKPDVPNKDEKPEPPLIHNTEDKHDTAEETEEDKARLDDVIPVVRQGNPSEGSKNGELIIDPTAEKAEAKTGSGSSIVLIMIIGVVVVGSAIVGYKYYKDRKPSYSSVNGHPKEDPTEGKELKEIKVEKTNNEPQCERIPLMEPKVPEIEFKEIVDHTDGNEITAKEAIGGENKTQIPNIDDDVSAKSVEVDEK